MKIIDAMVLLCCPGRNFLSLKTYTDEGVYGLGEPETGRNHFPLAIRVRERDSFLNNHGI